MGVKKWQKADDPQMTEFVLQRIQLRGVNVLWIIVVCNWMKIHNLSKNLFFLFYIAGILRGNK